MVRFPQYNFSVSRFWRGRQSRIWAAWPPGVHTLFFLALRHQDIGGTDDRQLAHHSFAGSRYRYEDQRQLWVRRCEGGHRGVGGQTPLQGQKEGQQFSHRRRLRNWDWGERSCGCYQPRCKESKAKRSGSSITTYFAIEIWTSAVFWSRSILAPPL